MKQYFDFRAWFEDQMAENELNADDLAGRLGVSPRKLGRLTNNSDDWTVDEVRACAEAFGLHWWDEFLSPLRHKGLRTRITLDECDQLFRLEGETLDRVTVAA